jgi:DNA-binding SARP family transcriptional activator
MTPGATLDTRLELEMLGAFRLRYGGRDVPLQPGTQRLLAFLAVQERPVQRAYVAGCLWPDTSQEQANANLRTTLWRLRRLDCPLVDATASELALAAGVRVDVRVHVERARRVLDDRADASDLDELVGAGDLLPELDDGWVLIERELFRQLRLHALETLCADLTTQGRYAEAVEAGLAAVIGEPLRESAHRALISAYLAEGNPSDALRQYQIFRDRLRRDLALAPSRALQHLVAGIVPPVTLA